MQYVKGQNGHYGKQLPHLRFKVVATVYVKIRSTTQQLVL